MTKPNEVLVKETKATHMQCYQKCLEELHTALRNRDFDAADKLSAILQRLK